MPLLAWDQLAERVNADGEFGVAGRHWTATLRLDVGEDHRRLRFEDGALQEVAACEADSPCDVFVSAPEEEWEALLAPIPRPFYQDLFGAATQHGFRLNDDPLDYAAYYPALRRLVQIFRDTREGS